MAKKQSKKSEVLSEVSLTELEVVTGGRGKGPGRRAG